MASSDEELISQGAYGKVFKKYDSESQQVVAVKKIKLGLVDTSDYEKHIERAMKEVEAMEKLDKHERIVQYIRHDMISDHKQKKVLHIFMEYIPRGTISSRLGSTGAFTEEETKRCMRQILEGLLFLHNERKIHRDVKGSNILFDENDNIKLCDFGLCKCLSELSSYNSTTTFVGTVHWMAPEIAAGEMYGRKVDIWSAGATMVEMLTTSPLWPTLNSIQLIYQISQKAKPKYDLDPSVSEGAKQLLDDVLVYDQDQRPSAEELLNRPWFGTASSVAGSSQSDLLTIDDDDGKEVEDMKFIILRLIPTSNPEIKQLFSNTEKVFAMTRKRGRALIINNMIFDKRPDLCRRGSDVDVENMSAMLKSLKFDVMIHTDLKAEEILSAIKSEVEEKEHEYLGCHVLVIMTHGGLNNYIYGTDLKRVKLTDVYDLLTPLNFPGMAGKPKVVILEVCSGERSDYGQRGIDRFDIGESQKEGESISPPLAKVPGDKDAEAMNRLNYDDLLVVKSSMESFIAKVHPLYGSLMIRALVSSMYKHACHHDLYTIFKQVQTKVRKLCVDRDFESGGQLVVVWDTLTHMRKLYLFPGFIGYRRDDDS